MAGWRTILMNLWVNAVDWIKWVSTNIDFFSDWDIRVNWSDYWDEVEEAFWHDEDMEFSISSENIEKLIEALKEEYPTIMKDILERQKDKVDNKYEHLTTNQRIIAFAFLSIFNVNWWYRKISEFLTKHNIDRYDYNFY